MNIHPYTILLFDTETDGLGNKDSIIEIAWKLVRSNDISTVIDSYSAFILPQEGSTITGDDWEHTRAFEANHISLIDCMENGVRKEEMMDAFIEAVKKADAITAYNLQFDQRMMAKWCNDEQCEVLASKQCFCTLEMARKALPELPKHKLEDVYNFLFYQRIINQHRAMGDVDATLRCLERFCFQGLCPVLDRTWGESAPAKLPREIQNVTNKEKAYMMIRAQKWSNCKKEDMRKQWKKIHERERLPVAAPCPPSLGTPRETLLMALVTQLARCPPGTEARTNLTKVLANLTCP